MAIYVKLQINDDLVVIFGGRRIEKLKEKDGYYTYLIKKYKDTPEGFVCPRTGGKKIKHRYSDGVEVLAEKILAKFNK